MDRRRFLQSGIGAAAAVAAGGLVESVEAYTKIKAVGVQLWSVRDAAQKDLPGTLKQLAAIGYKEVEAIPGFFDHSPKDFRQMLQDTGLSCTGIHEDPGTDKEWEERAATAHDVGARYLVNRWVPEEQRKTVDDYKRVAESFNRAGEVCQKNGVKYGFHNHFVELKKVDGTTLLDELVRGTDPKLVEFEMDAAWVTTGGGDPVDFVKRYPGRFTMFHVDDIKPGGQGVGEEGSKFATTVGQGTIPWAELFRIAGTGVKHYYVEFEGDDPFPSLKGSYEYLSRLKF